MLNTWAKCAGRRKSSLCHLCSGQLLSTCPQDHWRLKLPSSRSTVIDQRLGQQKILAVFQVPVQVYRTTRQVKKKKQYQNNKRCRVEKTRPKITCATSKHLSRILVSVSVSVLYNPLYVYLLCICITVSCTIIFMCIYSLEQEQCQKRQMLVWMQCNLEMETPWRWSHPLSFSNLLLGGKKISRNCDELMMMMLTPANITCVTHEILIEIQLIAF